MVVALTAAAAVSADKAPKNPAASAPRPAPAVVGPRLPPGKRPLLPRRPPAYSRQFRPQKPQKPQQRRPQAPQQPRPQRKSSSSHLVLQRPQPHYPAAAPARPYPRLQPVPQVPPVKAAAAAASKRVARPVKSGFGGFLAGIAKRFGSNFGLPSR